MPSKYPVLKPEEVVKRLEALGFIYVSPKGSHRKMSNGTFKCIIPMHDEVARGTVIDYYQYRKTLTKWRYVTMINLIKRIIYLIRLEKNWRDRTSDAPKAFKVSKN
ncbi:MAG: type II toxin-antitoxin system HicA family toxin, partial [Lachnospiraceae bacterium]|nr:type II toxin-antitoxin system HicA family toxin [Lachnospiraceae bacterium]